VGLSPVATACRMVCPELVGGYTLRIGAMGSGLEI